MPQNGTGSEVNYFTANDIKVNRHLYAVDIAISIDPVVVRLMYTMNVHISTLWNNNKVLQ